METCNIEECEDDLPVCPKCGEEINHLDVYCFETNRYEVGLTMKGDALDWSNSEVIESSETKRDYECPKCKSILFKTDNPHTLEKDVIIPFLRSIEGAWRETLYEEPETRMFTVHDREYYWTREEMQEQLGCPPEDAEEIWESGTTESEAFEQRREEEAEDERISGVYHD